MAMKMKNIAIIIVENNEKPIQEGVHDAMLKVGELPILHHTLSNLNRLDLHKILIVYDDFFAETNHTTISSIKDSNKNLFAFVQIKPEQTSKEITKEIFSQIPEDANNIVLISSNTPFVRLYSIYTAFDILDSTQHNNTTLLPYFVALGTKYGKLNQDIKDTFLEEKNTPTDINNDLVIYNPNVIVAHAKSIEELMKDSLKTNNVVATKNIVNMAIYNGFTAVYVEILEEELLTITNNKKLLIAENSFQKKMRYQMIEKGVRMIAPETVFFTTNTRISPNVVIHPYVIFGNDVIIESGSEIKSFSHIEGAHLEENSVIGPFARIRTGTIVGKDAKIGNFVEIKQSTISTKTKIPHLSYIGDTYIDSFTNIGAGTITCNYDGQNKYNTFIGKNCFIGSNTNIIAPIAIGDNSTIAAGSTITKDLKENTFAISRSKQINKKNKINKNKKEQDT